MKQAFYFIAIGDNDIRYAGMSVNSLRWSGFGGDIYVVADRSVQIPGATVVCIKDRSLEEDLYIPANAEGWKQRTPHSNLDYNMLRIVPELFFDIARYDRITYSDTDILYFANPEAWTCEARGVWVQKDDVSIGANLKRMSIAADAGNADIERPGVCSGLLSVEPSDYALFPEWKLLYKWLREAHGKCSNQPALNRILMEKPHHFIPGVEVGLFTPGCNAVHYWALYRQRMIKDYRRLFLGRLAGKLELSFLSRWCPSLCIETAGHGNRT